jgi:hypothetical protein
LGIFNDGEAKELIQEGHREKQAVPIFGAWDPVEGYPTLGTEGVQIPEPLGEVLLREEEVEVAGPQQFAGFLRVWGL